MLIKFFIEWYMRSTKGRICVGEKPSKPTVLACAERLFWAFKAVTRNKVAFDTRSRQVVYRVSSMHLFMVDAVLTLP